MSWDEGQPGMLMLKVRTFTMGCDRVGQVGNLRRIGNPTGSELGNYLRADCQSAAGYHPAPQLERTLSPCLPLGVSHPEAIRHTPGNRSTAPAPSFALSQQHRLKRDIWLCFYPSRSSRESCWKGPAPKWMRSLSSPLRACRGWWWQPCRVEGRWCTTVRSHRMESCFGLK